MKKIFYVFSTGLILMLIAVGLQAQKDDVRRPYTLTHHMTPEEKALFHTVGKDYVATDPPPGEIRNIAEYDRMEGVLVGYPGSFGISYDLIAAMSEETVVVTVVESNNQLNYVTNQYQSNGVNMDNAEFIVTALDSYWTRDYGPWYVAYGNDQIGIIDFVYNRPNRPNDNAIPPQMATYLGIEWFGMDLITAGGNYMTDGMGISSSSDLIWVENPDMSSTDIDQMLLDYCGVHTYHVLPDPNNTYIDHIDCWGKFLDVDKVLIREVPPSHPQFDEIEATADYYANQISSWGNNFQVYRVWTPNNEPYTNSLILNDRVFVPIMGGQWDDEALASYQEAMPGYEILGITGSWESTDALHCRTKGIADRNTLYIEHYPLLGDQPVQTEYGIDVEITAYSGQSVTTNEVKLIYWINDQLQDEIIMTHEGGKLYSAMVPAGQEGSKMEYYITATDDGGNMANHPFIGEPDPHVFFVGEELFPAMNLDVTEINAYVNQGNTDTQYFTMSNTGDIDLIYTLDFSSANLEDYSWDIEDSPEQDVWDYNTLTELDWIEFEVDNVVGEIAGWQLDFDWNTDQYGYESTFRVESPAGTEAIIAQGIPDGSYSINLDAFNGEQMQGTWTIWIEDSYGDGGHQATDISMTITKTYVIYPWLSVDPTGGIIPAGGSETFEVICSGTVLPVGEYEGSITITSNDPGMTEVLIPVYFTVDLPSGNEETNAGQQFLNYPNPFSRATSFYIDLEQLADITLNIFDVAGKLVWSYNEQAVAGEQVKITWDRTNLQGRKVEAGIYFYYLNTGYSEKSGKLVVAQ